MSAVIEIEEAHRTPNGQRYRVWHEGKVLIESCRAPFGDAARVLSKMGLTGRLQSKRKGGDKIEVSGLIAVAATLTVTEGQQSGPRFAKWSAMDEV